MMENDTATAPPDVLASLPLRPVRLTAHVYRYPVERPVLTSFGMMTERPAVIVEIEDADGSRGWGECWCNFPGCGAEHRARLLRTVIAPLVVDQIFDTPADALGRLSAATHVLAIQSGEPGPLGQIIAGVELALSDLAARRAGLPLWRWLARTGVVSPDRARAATATATATATAATATAAAAAAGGGSPLLYPYASGINPDAPDATARRCLASGYRAFKLKIGFGHGRDLANLERLRATIGDNLLLMADANQAWQLDEALAIVPRLGRFGLGWLEEPLAADRPWDEWRRLAAASPVPLAAGENIAGAAAFAAAVDSGLLAVLQPDIAKWGGFSGNAPAIASALAAGLRYCPHYLGAGIGLLGSAHLLAAFGGGLLEVDANDNPLRERLAAPLLDPLATTPGVARLGDAPGLGIEPDLGALARWRVTSAD